MFVKESDIKCVHFDEETQCCFYRAYKPDEEDYFHRNYGQFTPCFCTMIDEEVLNNPFCDKVKTSVWNNINYVAQCCRNYSTVPRILDEVTDVQV